MQSEQTTPKGISLSGLSEEEQLYLSGLSEEEQLHANFRCCAHPGCRNIHHSKTLCRAHYNAKFRREKAAEFSSMLQKGLASNYCAHPGCQNMQVAKTLCQVHYEAKRIREKAAKVSSMLQKGLAPNCCAHPGCQNMLIHARTLCHTHYKAALRRGANTPILFSPHPLPLQLAVAKIQTQKTTNKRLARRFETNESEIRALVTQEYTGEIKPKLEEGIGGDGVAAGTVPEPTLQAHYKAVQRRGGREKTNHPLPLHLAVAKLQTQKTTNKRLARRVVTNESEIRALVTQEYTGGIKPKLEEGVFY
jgi:hypothetical protein